MSFATQGMKMTRGSRVATTKQAASDKERKFSNIDSNSIRNFRNAPVIDYRPGINFSNMLASSQAVFPEIGKEYTVNLDAQGHTVNMQIQPLANTSNVTHDSKQVFLSSDQIADVASRIASEMCGKTLAEPLASHSAEPMPPHLVHQLDEMQRRINSLQSALRFNDMPVLANNTPQYTSEMQAVPPASCTSQLCDTVDLKNGLKHHADVLRAAQRKISSLENDMSHVMKMSSHHVQNMEMMDVGLRNQRSEIESSQKYMQAQAECMGLHDERIQQFATEAQQRVAENARFEERCKASVQSLRNECDKNVSVSASLQDRVFKMNAGLQNHQEVIRGMRRTYDTNLATTMATEAQMQEMTAGLHNHKEVIRSMRSSHDANVANIMATEKRISELNDGLHNHKEAIRTMRSSYDTNTAANNLATEKRFTELNDGLHNHKDAIRSMRSTYDSKHAASTAAEERIAELSVGLENHKTEIRMLKSIGSTVGNNSGNAEILMHLDRLGAGLTDHKNEIRSLKSQMTSSQQNSTRTNSVLTHLEALDAGLEEHKSEIRSLKSAIGKTASRANMEALDAGLQNHRSEIRSMRSDLSNNLQEIGSMRVSTQPVTAQLNAMQHRLDAMQNSMMAQTAERSLAPPQERTATTVTRNDLSSFLQRRPNR